MTSTATLTRLFEITKRYFPESLAGLDGQLTPEDIDLFCQGMGVAQGQCDDVKTKLPTDFFSTTQTSIIPDPYTSFGPAEQKNIKLGLALYGNDFVMRVADCDDQVVTLYSKIRGRDSLLFGRDLYFRSFHHESCKVALFDTIDDEPLAFCDETTFYETRGMAPFRGATKGIAVAARKMHDHSVTCRAAPDSSAVRIVPADVSF